VDKNGNETVLYSFKDGADGSYPYAGVMRDAKGNLYGATNYGGDLPCHQPYGCGTVFKLNATGPKTILYSFTGGTTDGCYPSGRLIQDKAGNLYGTASECGAYGYGTVFKLRKSGIETVLHNFAGGTTDGGYPFAGLIMDGKGNLYGDTFEGGAGYDHCGFGCGALFKLDTSGKETVLYSFTGGSDGAYLYAGVIRDAKGNLYGATGEAACFGSYHSCGTVFKLNNRGKLTVLYSFTGGSDGRSSVGGVIRDAKGNLYGTTNAGGDLTCGPPAGCGVVFKLTKAGKETVLYSFTGGSDGATPEAGLIQDRNGNLYGTAFYGGGSTNCVGFLSCGTVWKLTP